MTAEEELNDGKNRRGVGCAGGRGGKTGREKEKIAGRKEDNVKDKE